MADASHDAPDSALMSFVIAHFSDRAISGSRVPLQALDKELDVLQRSLYRARQLRNMRAGACGLLREILACIFSYLQSIWPPRREYTKESSPEQDPVFHAGWISVTHVCSYWRELALEVPSLWSKPTLDILSIPHQYIPDILFRSRSAPLALALKWESDSIDLSEDAGFIAWLSPSVLRRARSLEVLATLDIIELVAACLATCQDMDQLHELDLTLTDSTNATNNSPLPVFFRRHLTEVTKLSLDGFRVPWKSRILSSRITHLSLIQSQGGSRPSYGCFCDIVALLQSLERLALEEIVPRSVSDSDRNAIITFPSSLKWLTVIIFDPETVLDGLHFVSRIRTVPQCNRDYLFSGIGQSGIPDMSFFDDMLRGLLPIFSFADCDDIELHYLDLTGLTVRTIGLPLGSSQPQSSSWNPPKLESGSFTTNGLLAPGFVRDTPPFDVRISSYLSSIALEHIHTMSLDIATVRRIDRYELWSEFLRGACVRHVSVLKPEGSCDDLVKLMNALRRRHVRTTGDEPHVLFPRLVTVALPLFLDEARHRELIVSLIDLLHARREQGSPLHELVIPQQAGGWAVWNTLRAIVQVTLIEYPINRSPMIPETDGFRLVHQM